MVAGRRPAARGGAMKSQTRASGETAKGGGVRSRTAAAPRLVSAEVIQDRSREVYDAVSRRAYEIFEQRGGVHGAHEEDWFRAEAELLQAVEADVAEAGPSVTVHARIPGFSADEIELAVEARSVTIAGTHRTASAPRKGNVVRAGGCASRIFRVVELPCEVDVASVTVAVRSGALELRLRKGAGGAEVRRVG